MIQIFFIYIAIGSAIVVAVFSTGRDRGTEDLFKSVNDHHKETGNYMAHLGMTLGIAYAIAIWPMLILKSLANFINRQ